VANDANLFTPERTARAQAAATSAGLDALLVSPGPDLRYLTGYEALPLERLTCLVAPAAGDPFLVVPLLEKPAAEVSPVGDLGFEIIGWRETEDPYELIAKRLGSSVRRVGLDNHMWAEKVLAFRDAMPGVEQALAGDALAELRMRKSTAEIAALSEAATAIDAVHLALGEWLRPGRTEREVGKDIAEAILAAGHATVDFVIVASGPNGASPHHEVSDRVIQAGEPVVVDIGGTMPSGYCSDSTRNYCIGEAPAEYLRLHGVLLAAQTAQCESIVPGMTSEQLDAIGRDLIAGEGYGDRFIHRTGHGIGLETHEEPYIVAGSKRVLEPGMAFSVEPGIYIEGRFGARIEDIAVCKETGGERLNITSRELRVLA
jgi:Xaa-Pro aminopeptidase